jgi:hypothetical protein
MTVPLADLLRSHPLIAGGVEEAVFGSTDPEMIASLIDDAARRQAGVAVEGGLFFAASSGCVLGLRLADGQSAVLKAYQPRWELPFLRAVQRVQRAVAQRGFPCPKPMAEPVAVGAGWATMESLLPDPGPRLFLDDGSLERSSAGLVRLLDAAADSAHDDLELHPFRIAHGDLYPTPHSPIFDLAGTGHGAEWIDEWARRSRSQKDDAPLPLVVAYLDWSARNVRMDQNGLVAVYDWDSVSVASEAVTAGQAAATWRSTGETLDVRAPDAEEIVRFIGAFAVARGAPFSARETEVACAAAVWVMAYTARCEHALEQRTQWRRSRARDWLRSQARLLMPDASVS